MVDVQAHILTAGQFESVVNTTENRERLLELVHGEVVEKVPTEEHGTLAALIAHFLLSFILSHGIKAHVGVEVRHQSPDDQYNSRLPDVSLRFSDAAPLASGVVPYMPDLAVEIQSSHDRPHQMREKALYYLQKGTRLVWLVFPSDRHIEVCTLDANDNLGLQSLDQSGTLTGGEMLSGFALPVSDLFASR